jgi:hypothetical protein
MFPEPCGQVVSGMLEKSKSILAVFVAFFMISSVFIGTSWSSPNIVTANLKEGFQTSSASSIVIDGNLSVNEWTDAVHKIQWFMDADPSNSDGFNYMYLDEDPYNLYIALDLCSDQTNDSLGEWVGLWLNTNQAAIFNPEWNIPLEWEAALNNGIESLLHDVEKEKTIPFFDDEGAWNTLVERPSDWIVVDGTLTGSQDEIMWDDSSYLNMTSEFNGTHYVYRCDVDVDFYDSFPIFEDLFVEHSFRVRFWLRLLNNATIYEHFLSVSDDLGDLNPDIHLDMSTGTTEVVNFFDIYRENFTTDSTLRLSMNGVYDAPFNTSFDLMNYEIYYNDTTNIGQRSVYPYATIRDYDIAWAFGPTENNASDHRSFEFKIPKSELEGYEMDTELGIIAGGYGTLASWPGTHRWVFANSKLTGIPEEDSSQYINYSMPMKGWTPPGAPVIAAISPNPDPDGNVLVNWNDATTAESWTVYRHSSEITEANLESATEIAADLTESQYNDTGLSEGTYWYAVEAIDEFGYSYLSNSVSVTVEFPVTTPTQPPPFDPTLILLLGGAGAVVLLVVVVIILRKR